MTVYPMGQQSREQGDVWRSLLRHALRTGGTGMYPGEDGSTVYVLRGRIVERAQFEAARRRADHAGARSDTPRNPVTFGIALRLSTVPRWRTRLRVCMVALGIRAALRLGYLVVLVGPARSGKTRLLELAVPGCVLHTTRDVTAACEAGTRCALRDLALPAQPFGIDEFAYLKRQTLAIDLALLRDRAFAIAVQSVDVFVQLGAVAPIAARRRIEIRLLRD